MKPGQLFFVDTMCSYASAYELDISTQKTKSNPKLVPGAYICISSRFYAPPSFPSRFGYERCHVIAFRLSDQRFYSFRFFCDDICNLDTKSAETLKMWPKCPHRRVYVVPFGASFFDE